MDARSDASLVAAALGGDQTALATMYERYADHLFTFCLSRLRNPDQAADAMHDTFVRAASKLGDLRSPEKLRSWLFSIARNEIVNQTRHASRSVTSDRAHELADASAGPETDLLAAERADLLWSAAAALNERDVELLELNLRHGLEGAELAEALEVSSSHLHVMQSRLRNRVQMALGSLLVARRGRSDCNELAAMLASWDGRFTVAIRSQVTRHVRACEICEGNERIFVAPGNLFSALPLATAPLLLRDRTVAAMSEQVAASPTAVGTTVATQAHGGPEIGLDEASDASHPRRRVANVAAVFILLLLVLGIAIIVADPFEPDSVLEVATDRPAPNMPIDTTIVVATTELPVVAAPVGSTAPMASTAPTSTPAVGTATRPTDRGAANNTVAATSSTTTMVATSPGAAPSGPLATPPAANQPIPPAPAPPEPGRLEASPTSLDLSDGSVRTITITNVGGLPVTWTVNPDGPFAGSGGGELAPGASTTVATSVVGIAPHGTSSGALVFSGGGHDLRVPLTATLDKQAPSITSMAAVDPWCREPITLDVGIDDADDVASMIADWTTDSGQSGSAVLGRSGSAYHGSIGPVTGLTQVAVVVTARDAADNVSTSSTTFSVSCLI